MVALDHRGLSRKKKKKKKKKKIEHRAQKAHNQSIYRHTAARILININSLLLRFQISRIRRYAIEYESTSMEQARFNPQS